MPAVLLAPGDAEAPADVVAPADALAPLAAVFSGGTVPPPFGLLDEHPASTRHPASTAVPATPANRRREPRCPTSTLQSVIAGINRQAAMN